MSCSCIYVYKLPYVNEQIAPIDAWTGMPSFLQSEVPVTDSNEPSLFPSSVSEFPSDEPSTKTTLDSQKPSLDPS